MSADSVGQDVFLQYGAIGIIALLALLAVRVMFAKLSAAYDREKERADRLEEQLNRLNEALRNDYLHSINAANRAVADALATARRGPP